MTKSLKISTEAGSWPDHSETAWGSAGQHRYQAEGASSVLRRAGGGRGPINRSILVSRITAMDVPSSIISINPTVGIRKPYFYLAATNWIAFCKKYMNSHRQTSFAPTVFNGYGCEQFQRTGI
jgi:hypothetical protein